MTATREEIAAVLWREFRKYGVEPDAWASEQVADTLLWKFAILHWTGEDYDEIN